MALTYLSGNRIQGSTGASGSDGWSINTAQQTIGSGVLDWKADSDSSSSIDGRAVYDLGVGNEIDGDFVIRFKGTFDAKSSPTPGRFFFWVSNADNAKAINGEDALVMDFHDDLKIRALATNSAQGFTGTSGSKVGSFSTGNTYYFEFKRDGTALTGQVFTASDFSTGASSVTTTTLASAFQSEDYRYIGFKSTGGGWDWTPEDAYQDWTFDDIVIYDNQTSATTATTTLNFNDISDDKDTCTNVVAGTLFEETDTQELYRMYDGSGSTMPSAATGGTVTTDGDYKVHTFTDTGTFTVTARASQAPIKVLVVAGGGGGGKAYGGGSNHWDSGCGGGAGGFRLIDKTTLATGTNTFAVVVGAKGNGHHYHGGVNASNGGASTFATGTADAIDTSGGGHGGRGACDAATGGSGGGRNNMAGNIGGYDPVEGYRGGNSTGGCTHPNTNTSHGGGGGGGGASEVGNNSSGNDGGAGGDGRGTDIVTSGTTLYYAGGGSGSNGEHGGSNAAATLGGGGAGGGSNASASGSNAGYGSGGGGGSGEYGQAGRGFDGVVIIRYKFQNFKEWKGKGVA